MSQHHMLARVLLVGDAECGKKSLLGRFFFNEWVEPRRLEEEFPVYRSKTIELDDGSVVKLQMMCISWDERMETNPAGVFRGAHALVACYDVGQRETFESVGSRWLRLCSECASESTLVYMAACKADQEEPQVAEKEGRTFALKKNEYYDDIPFLQTSALTGANVQSLFKDVATRVFALYQAAAKSFLAASTAPTTDADAVQYSPKSGRWGASARKQRDRLSRKLSPRTFSHGDASLGGTALPITTATTVTTSKAHTTIVETLLEEEHEASAPQQLTRKTRPKKTKSADLSSTSVVTSPSRNSRSPSKSSNGSKNGGKSRSKSFGSGNLPRMTLVPPKGSPPMSHPRRLLSPRSVDEERDDHGYSQRRKSLLSLPFPKRTSSSKNNTPSSSSSSSKRSGGGTPRKSRSSRSKRSKGRNVSLVPSPEEPHRQPRRKGPVLDPAAAFLQAHLGGAMVSKSTGSLLQVLQRTRGSAAFGSGSTLQTNQCISNMSAVSKALREDEDEDEAEDDDDEEELEEEEGDDEDDTGLTRLTLSNSRNRFGEFVPRYSRSIYKASDAIDARFLWNNAYQTAMGAYRQMSEVHGHCFAAAAWHRMNGNHEVELRRSIGTCEKLIRLLDDFHVLVEKTISPFFDAFRQADGPPGFELELHGLHFRLFGSTVGSNRMQAELELKQAANEYRGYLSFAAHLLELKPSKHPIHLPMMTMIDYLGFRILASAAAPVDAADGGLLLATVEGTTPGLARELIGLTQRALEDFQLLGRFLNLKPHWVGPDVATQILWCSGASLQLRLGADRCVYLTNFSSVFPSVEIAKQSRSSPCSPSTNSASPRRARSIPTGEVRSALMSASSPNFSSSPLGILGSGSPLYGTLPTSSSSPSSSSSSSSSPLLMGTSPTGSHSSRSSSSSVRFFLPNARKTSFKSSGSNPRVLRPEFLLHYKKPLCSNGFSAHIQFDPQASVHNEELLEAQHDLLSGNIPAFCTVFTHQVRRLMKRSMRSSLSNVAGGMHGFNFTAVALPQLLHEYGISLRMLGRIISHLIYVAGDNDEDTAPLHTHIVSPRVPISQPAMSTVAGASASDSSLSGRYSPSSSPASSTIELKTVPISSIHLGPSASSSSSPQKNEAGSSSRSRPSVLFSSDRSSAASSEVAFGSGAFDVTAQCVNLLLGEAVARCIAHEIRHCWRVSCMEITTLSDNRRQAMCDLLNQLFCTALLGQESTDEDYWNTNLITQLELRYGISRTLLSGCPGLSSYGSANEPMNMYMHVFSTTITQTGANLLPFILQRLQGVVGFAFEEPLLSSVQHTPSWLPRYPFSPLDIQLPSVCSPQVRPGFSSLFRAHRYRLNSRLTAPPQRAYIERLSLQAYLKAFQCMPFSKHSMFGVVSLAEPRPPGIKAKVPVDPSSAEDSTVAVDVSCRALLHLVDMILPNIRSSLDAATYSAFATYLAAYQQDPVATEDAYLCSLELNPDCPTTLRNYSRFLRSRQQHQAARSFKLRAQVLSGAPTSRRKRSPTTDFNSPRTSASRRLTICGDTPDRKSASSTRRRRKQSPRSVTPTEPLRSNSREKSRKKRK